VIKLPPRALPAALQAMLDDRQASLDALPDYAARVTAAKRAWDNKHRESFKAVRAELHAMCSGEDRCMYCEDSAADEIEHVRPKNLYPEHTFRWENYLVACGPCNGPKEDHFPILSETTGRIVDGSRKRDAPVVPPEVGRMMLLDPRRDDPAHFLFLDLADSFHFVPQPRRGCVARARAWKTIEVLHLNDDPRPRRRRVAYGNYTARLRQYIHEGDAAARERYRKALQRLDQPTVWHEMKRQRRHIADLRALFDKAREALAWPI
jgi:uncharacterized protein (TIGR02646 family)